MYVMAFLDPYREKPARPAKEIICAGCGEKFYHRASGVPKYCVDCRDVTDKERRNRYKREQYKRRQEATK